MENPLEATKEFVVSEIAKAKLALHIELDEETVTVVLSRLLTLNSDPKRQADYQAALTALGGKE